MGQERRPVKGKPGLYVYTRYGRKCYGFVVDVGEGRRRQITRQGFSSLEAAEKERTAYLHRRHTGDVVEPSRELLRDFFRRWLELRRPLVRARTITAYREDFARADQYLGGMELRQIRADHIQGMIAGMQGAGYAAKTIRKAVDIVRRVFNAAVSWGLLLRSPAVSLNLPPLREDRPPMLTAEQLAQLVTSSADTHWGLMIRTLVETWMRAGELCDLRWGAIDPGRNVIRVERALSEGPTGGYVSLSGKTAAARREIVVSRALVEALMTEKERQRFRGPVTDETPVFWTSTGARVWPGNVGGPVKRACRHAGVPVVNPHWLRHSGISVARLAGGDIVTISQRAGHKDIKTTLGIYSHTRIEEHRTLGEAFGALLDAHDDASASPDASSVLKG